MTTSAIVLMIVSIGLLWGGLVLNILRLRYRKAPDEVLYAAQEARSTVKNNSNSDTKTQDND